MAVVRRIGPVSALKVGFVVYALIGLIPGIFCTTIALAGIPFGPHKHLPHFVPLFAVIFAPLFYGIIGAILTVIGSLIYNLASTWVGGLEVDIDKTG
jgi:hypothetical protein